MQRTTAITTVELTGEHALLTTSLIAALTASGHDACVSGDTQKVMDELVVMSALGNGEAGDIHWRALEHIKQFRHVGGKSMVLLQDTGGRFTAGPSQGWCGGMAALARTAALEWPDMNVRCIDIAVDNKDLPGTARRLQIALASGVAIVGVDLKGHLQQLQASTVMSRPRQSTVPVCSTSGDGNVWVVSGGARGVTAACVEALAQRMSSGRFALLGRSSLTAWPTGVELTDDIKLLRQRLASIALAAGDRPVPKDIERTARQALASEEIRTTLTNLEAAGVCARYYACDIASQQQVNDVVARIQHELGTVTSLAHGAGVLADSLLMDKTRQQFDHVFSTKVNGLQNLLSALGDSPLSHVALFSSAAAFYGNTGQGDYAMANEVLNRVAHALQNRWPESTVKSFNWGPWDSGMVDVSLARYFSERGIKLIPVKEGAVLFADEMLSASRRASVLLIGDDWAG